MQNSVPVFFFGSDAIAVPLLESLWESHCDPACALRLEAVVAQPDRRSGRGQQLQSNPVSAWAAKRGLTVFKPDKPDEALVETMQQRACQLALVMAYGHLLRLNLRASFPLGMLNFHASLLPRLRGASPVESAIAEGFEETGVSLMRIEARMDAGAVADMERVTIESDTTGPELRKSLAAAARVLWERNRAAALLGELCFWPQEEAQASYCRKLAKDDGQLDFHLPADQLANQVRAYVDWPGCFFKSRGQRIKVGAAVAVENWAHAQRPGQVIAKGKFLEVATSAGVLRIQQLQKPGGRMLDAESFLRGFDPGNELI